MSLKFVIILRPHPSPASIHFLSEGEEVTIFDIGEVRRQGDEIFYCLTTDPHIERGVQVGPFQPLHLPRGLPSIGNFDTADEVMRFLSITDYDRLATALGVESTPQAIRAALGARQRAALAASSEEGEGDGVAAVIYADFNRTPRSGE